MNDMEDGEQLLFLQKSKSKSQVEYSGFFWNQLSD
jgi:hypothetical protein